MCNNVIVVIISFGNKLAKDLVEENPSKELRAFPAELHRAARKKLNMLHAAKNLDDLKFPPGNRLRKLKGARSGDCSISINDQWRVIFEWRGNDAHKVTVEDYH